MLTPMEMFEAAAQVEPDWVREFARYVASDDRVKLCVPHPTALKNALKTLKRRTGVSPLYSLSVLDNDMAVVRQVRDVYLHTEHPGHVVKLRSAMKEAFRYIDESATDLATRLDKIARRQAVD
jgi:hypothetical protein